MQIHITKLSLAKQEAFAIIKVMHIYPYLNVIGFSLDLVGKVLISYTALLVNYRFLHEHKIDEKVFSAMKREQVLGLLGVICMIVGYLMQLPFKLP